MYESPTLTEVGSVRDLTLGEGWNSWDDSIQFFGFVIPLPGTPSS